ncbi:MAG: hypothetical protein AB1414_18755 [bacterium]
MKKIIAVFVFLTLVVGCAPTRKLVTLNVDPNEAIVIGRLSVSYNGEDVTQKVTLFFNEIMWGKYSYKTDETGYIFTYLPLGKNHFARIAYKDFIYNFPKDYATFDLTTNSAVNYIGDLKVEWNGPKFKMPNMFGMLGALADEAVNDGKIEITVLNKSKECKEIFDKHYPNQMGLREELVKIKK